MSVIHWIAAAALGLGMTAAGAQPFPAKPVTFIVPFAAGGPSDALARVLAQAMAQPLGQQVVVENVTGAGGTVGAARGAQARADGHTILLSHIGQASSVTLYRKLPYHPVESFEAVAMIAEVPMVLVGRKDLEPKDAAELIRFVRTNKDRVTYGNGGVGSASHLCGLLLMTALKADMTTVSYRGSGPAMQDVLGGRLDLLCDQTTTTVSHIRAAAVRGYAVTMSERIASLPEAPTLHEAGLRDFSLAVWYGLVAPRGTPEPVVQQLASALRAAIADPGVSKRLSDFGAQPISGERATPAGAARFFRAEVDRLAPIIKAAGVYAD
ncbi:MAG TPA: tripartite tricarboxylate transporter substrate-binding protein [Burkholderiales bacterium]|nr:tripartite tricarboxylate transporter substrate-binding protein [Burkholderiales bacterium]